MVLPVRADAVPRALRVLGRIEGILAGLLVICVLFLVIFQVFTRYVLNSPVAWTEELARFALIWLAFIGAGWVAFRGNHVTVRLGDDRLSPRARLWLDALAGVLALVICGALLWGAGDFLVTAGRTTSPALGWPMGWVYGASVLGYVLVMAHTVISLVLVFRHPDALRTSLGVDAELGDELTGASSDEQEVGR